MRAKEVWLALALAALPARAAFGGGSVDIRSATPETFAAVQSVVQGPDIAGLAADAPGLALMRTIRADSAEDLSALGLLQGFLPADFPAQAAAAAAGDATAREAAVTALRRAYAQAAAAAPSVIEARAKSIKRALLAGRLTPGSWRAAADSLSPYALYGQKAENAVAEWRRWAAQQTGRAALKVARAGQQALAVESPAAREEASAGPIARPKPRVAPVVSLAKLKERQATEPSRLRAAKILVPVGTPLKLDLLTPAHSENARHGEELIYELASDVFVGGKRALRRGATANGIVGRVRRRGIMGKAGAIEAQVSELVLPSGATILLKEGIDRSAPADTKSVLLALLYLGAIAVLHLVGAPASLMAMLAMVLGTALIFILVPGFKGRLRSRITALTAEEFLIDGDDAPEPARPSPSGRFTY